MHGKLHELLVCCWEQGKLPQELRDAVIITLYKNKGEISDCGNYLGITLLSIAGKVLARLLLNMLVPSIAEEHLPETQCDFRANRSTTDMVFVLRQLQEKCREQNMGLYPTFVDLKKAFDTVSRKGLWSAGHQCLCQIILYEHALVKRLIYITTWIYENQLSRHFINSLKFLCRGLFTV